MTLPASGPISFNAINVELSTAGTTSANINQASYRTLAGVASGQISLSNFYGKTYYPKTTSVNYLVVAGGGGGGCGRGGGAGAGGFLSSSIGVSAGSPITVTVGGGGSQYSTGSNSVFSSITASGGGYGGSECYLGANRICTCRGSRF